MTLPITREQALELIQKYDKDPYDMYHYLESEAIMGALAKRLGEDEEYWKMLGLLHDVDWGITKGNTTEHNPPHFVVEMNNGEAFRVKIPPINENILTEKDIVFLDEHTLTGKDIKNLVSWLKSRSKKAKQFANIDVSNLKYIVTTWNLLNSDDDNIDKIDASIFN